MKKITLNEDCNSKYIDCLNGQYNQGSKINK